ncbi:MAG TPA: hypothetical protein VEB18_03470 [Candidatus Paceibacterota bacterium]|nr:hypothetical protein [Candidatus Paceibacterota bacterium]
MTRTNLAYLDRAADEAVTIQLQNPGQYVDRSSVKHVRIAGIACRDGDPIEKRRQALADYREDAAALKTQLTDAGVSYLAILPTRAWNEISKQTGLYRFRPNEEGEVLASDRLITEATARAHRAVAWRPLAALAVGLMIGGLVGFALASFINAPLFVVIGAVLTFAILGGYAYSTVVNSRYFFKGTARPASLATMEERFIRSSVPKKRKALFDRLWPQGQELEDGVRIAIELPPAPEDAQHNLLRAKDAGLKLTVDAVMDAVQLPHDVGDVLVASRAAHWLTEKTAMDKREEQQRRDREERRRRQIQNFWDSLALDPIVITQCGSATAIIVQYGDFPVEQAAVDRVLHSTSLI